MTEDAAILTLPLTPEGELEPRCNAISGVFQKLPDVFKETLGPILGAEIEVSEPRMASFSKEELVSAIDPATVCLVHTTFTEGIEGASFMIAKNDLARALGELIPVAAVEEADDALSADSTGAFLELVSQIFEKVNLSFSEVAGSTVSADTVTAFDKDSQELSELIPDGDAFCAEFGVSVPDKLDGTVFFLYSASAVEHLAAPGEARAP